MYGGFPSQKNRKSPRSQIPNVTVTNPAVTHKNSKVSDATVTSITEANKKIRVDIIHAADKHMYVELYVATKANEKIRLIVDTGAHRNFLRKDMIKRLKIEKVNYKENIPVSGISKTQVTSIGSVWLKLLVKNVPFSVKFHILEDLFAPALLGAEFLKLHTKQIGEQFKFMILQRFPESTDKTEDIEVENDQGYAALFTREPKEQLTQEKWEEQMITEALDLDAREDCDFLEYKNLKPLVGLDRISKLADIIDLTHIEPESVRGIKELIGKYNDIFFIEGDRLTCTDAAVHIIETTTNIPINKRQYRFPMSTKVHINEQVDEMLRQGIIRPSVSPWNAPVLCIPKKQDLNGNKRYRIVVDFRALNTITKGAVFPIPLINEILDNIGDSSYFTSIDLKSGFYQVPIHAKDAEKTAFSTPKGHYEFTRMPMGLKNSPSTFQKLMTTVMYGIGEVNAFVYLDDIIVFGRSITEHNDHLKRVLEALRVHNLKIEPNKCQFLRKEIQYLGHTITKDGVKPTNANIKAVHSLSQPKSVKDVRSFLGAVNFYGKFIPNIAEKRKPLNDLLKKNVKFSWTEQCEKAFKDLKECLVSEPLLVRPNYNQL